MMASKPAAKNVQNKACAILPPLPTTTGELLGVKPGSEDASTYNKTKYGNSTSIKFMYLWAHSHLGDYVLEYGDRKVRIGKIDDKVTETLAFHDADTRKWIGSYGGLDTLATKLSGNNCDATWKEWRIIKDGVDACSLQDFRYNWAEANGRLKPNAESSAADSTQIKTEDENDGQGCVKREYGWESVWKMGIRRFAVFAYIVGFILCSLSSIVE